MTPDPARHDDPLAEIRADLARLRQLRGELWANAVVIVVLLLTLAVVMQLGAEAGP